MNANSPIGVFDSGLGGLTVLNALRRALPGEDYVYLGDVARLPYGTKSGPVVERYASQCLQFLKKQEIKLVVVACNTASALALNTLCNEFSSVFGVITASVKAALETSKSRVVPE